MRGSRRGGRRRERERERERERGGGEWKERERRREGGREGAHQADTTSTNLLQFLRREELKVTAKIIEAATFGTKYREIVQ